jgi:sulfate permease, SulP family
MIRPMPPAALQVLARFLGPWVRSVNAVTLRADVQAGLLGALLVLPQGIASASLAGLPPQYGLYSALVPTVIAALAGSSWHVVSGPTNANSLALAAMLAPLVAAGSPGYIELALMVTVMVGVIQTAVGALRLGLLANFISPAALLGFTSGAACLIAIHALRDLMDAGVPRGLGPGGVLLQSWQHLPQANPGAVLVGLTALGVAAGLRLKAARWPFMLIGLVSAGVLAVLLPERWAVHTIGALPSPWPSFHVPDVDWARVPDLIDKALALSIIALGQSVSIAKAMAARSGQRIDTNREFLGQGLSNVVGGFFSCYLSCGSLNRSVPNLEAGARTPLAGVASAGWLLVLVAVAWTLLDLPRWRRLARLDRTDLAIAGATLAATLLLRALQPLAARLQREHERPGPPVPAQGHGSVHRHPPEARLHRGQARRAAGARGQKRCTSDLTPPSLTRSEVVLGCLESYFSLACRQLPCQKSVYVQRARSRSRPASSARPRSSPTTNWRCPTSTVPSS